MKIYKIKGLNRALIIALITTTIDLDNLEIHLQNDQKYKEYDQYQEYEGELKDYDAKFIAQARDALKNGFDIIYTNNW